MSRLFVAIGDSFTEGVGDWEPRLPNGVRGWADRVAKQLSKEDPGWRYANLAIRSRRLDRIIEEQIEPALAMNPDVISFYAGGNDILEFRKDLDAVLANYTAAVERLATSGAQILLFTGFDIPVHPMLAPFKRRNWKFNDRVRELALQHGDTVTLVDYWEWEVYRDRRMWDVDKLHMNRAGHRYMAIRVLEILGANHQLAFEDFGDIERVSPVQAVRRDVEWLRQWVLPMFGRRIRGVTLGDELEPRWQQPIRPADGMKKLYRKGLQKKARRHAKTPD
ncbi:lipase [Arthrobacter sp. MYb211]|uniref:SGNH/GDSL hydrolase family protein n=1 Tax=unclassified Arthrobacter TaxID=235627 RepID=UPI000CFBDB06|nr:MULTISPECIES: SGNH/GDSL hydrolase family protein [unclassified Arthrobacter]PRA04510.1 lipase [Arthrobacter sp. MYb229]PRA12243.1 lipase [Arthrobacter sp. MYb221]PRB51577.1 lipase [Arthrobacter sp. MYb216]PRC08705.1 lipase [Arthrobacter sp. MYb211]